MITEEAIDGIQINYIDELTLCDVENTVECVINLYAQGKVKKSEIIAQIWLLLNTTINNSSRLS